MMNKLVLNEDVFEPVVIEVPDVVAQVPEVVDETPTGPETGADSGIANQLIDMINDEWATIQKYNDLIVNLTAYGHIDFVATIQDILNEENVHVGQLHSLLETISPNAQSFEQGKLEGENDIDIENNFTEAE